VESTVQHHPHFVSRLQAALILNISERGVDGLLQRGHLRSIRAGKRVLIFRDSLENFISTGTGSNAPEEPCAEKVEA